VGAPASSSSSIYYTHKAAHCDNIRAGKLLRKIPRFLGFLKKTFKKTSKVHNLGFLGF